MNPDDLIGIARLLVHREAGRPKQASLKRAVSTAYYALFHAVAHECVGETIGWNFQSDRYWAVVGTLYRAVDHVGAKRVFNQVRNTADATDDLKEVARIFVDIQAERIRADYDPAPTFKRRDALQIVVQAEDAIQRFQSLPKDIKREVVVQLLARQR